MVAGGTGGATLAVVHGAGSRSSWSETGDSSAPPARCRRRYRCAVQRCRWPLCGCCVSAAAAACPVMQIALQTAGAAFMCLFCCTAFSVPMSSSKIARVAGGRLPSSAKSHAGTSNMLRCSCSCCCHSCLAACCSSATLVFWLPMLSLRTLSNLPSNIVICCCIM